MTDLRTELERVLALAEKATPGPWRWSENGNIMAPGSRDVDEIAAVYTERDDDLAPVNAEAIIAALNFLRTHGRALAGALEDAASYRALCDGVGADMVKQASEKFGDALGVMRDAERYRWLRKFSTNAYHAPDSSRPILVWQGLYDEGWIGRMDEAIDAAMSQHTARDGGGEG